MAGEFTDIDVNERRPISKERYREITRFISGIIKDAIARLVEHGSGDNSLESFDDSRGYQIGALDATWVAREAGIDSGLLHLATGLGKTSLGILDYAKFAGDRAQNGERTRGLFVVHQKNILKQAMGRFAAMLPHVKASRFKRGGVNPDADLTFATFQSLTRNVDKIPSDAFDYIIYDEAHHIKADTYEKVVEHFKPAFKLALTATPEREDGKQIEDHFGRALYSVPLEEALAKRYLAAVRYTPMYDDAVVELVESGFKPEKLATLKQLLEVEMRNEEMAVKIKEKQRQICEEEGLDECKTIIFCADLDHADSMADLTGGISYHSRKDPKEQDAILDGFRAGEHNTITVKDMFNEGVDIPDARLIVMIRSTGSKRILEQQLGRGLRKTATKKIVDVMDFVAGIERVDMIYSMAKRIQDWVEKIKEEQAEDEWGEFESSGRSNGGAKPVEAFASEFVFTEQWKGTLDHYRYLLEQQELADWSKYTNDELVALALKISPNKPLTSDVIRELSAERKFPSLTLVESRFGSIVGFQRACGFEVIVCGDLTDREIVELALNISPNKMLTTTVMDELSAERKFLNASTISRRFGSIPAFQRACGFEVEDRTDRADLKSLDQKGIIALALKISPEEPLSSKRICDLSKENKFPGQVVIKRSFGSIVEFQRACGFEVVERVDWDKVGNCKLVRLALELSPDKPLTQLMINNLSKDDKFPSTSAIEKRFGSIPAFQRACGFEVKDKIDWSDVDDKTLLANAIQLSPDKPLSRRVADSLSKDNKLPSVSTIKKRFGSYSNFQRLVELQKLQLALGQVLAKPQD